MVDPSKAQDVIERKYTDIISEEKIYISSCDLCYYQKENYRNQNEVQLSPIYAFSIKTAKKNPEMKIFVDACTGEEIIVDERIKAVWSAIGWESVKVCFREGL